MDDSKNKYLYLGWCLLVGALAVLLAFLALGQRPAGDDNYRTAVVANDLPADLDYESVEQIYDLIRTRFDGPLSQEDLITGLKKGLVEATGDPHSEYLDETQSRIFDEFLSGEFEGVGIELTDRDGFLTVVAPIEGSPAYDAGLKPKDIILEIDGQSTSRMTISEAVRLIRGPAGTVVELKIHREGVEPSAFAITRDLISLPSVSWRVEDGIGLIRISHFNNDVGNLLAEAVADFASQSPAGIILDLRSNPGGEVSQTLVAAGFWLGEDQTVVKYYVAGQPVGSDGAETPAGFDRPPFVDLPTAVLIDDNSASASEILAGALRDGGKATLVGQPSFGKGSVQELIKPTGPDDPQTLKLTVSRFYTPGGQPIDGVGLNPDFVVANPEPDGSETIVDAQLEKAKSLIKQADGQN